MENYKELVRKRVEALVDKLADEKHVPKELIGNEIYYIVQRNREWGRNPSEAQKKNSFKHYGGICHKCKKQIGSFDNAVFHHNQRGILGQHEPKNMVPQHSKCHDNEHGIYKGSLLKGSPKNQS